MSSSIALVGISYSLRKLQPSRGPAEAFDGRTNRIVLLFYRLYRGVQARMYPRGYDAM